MNGFMSTSVFLQNEHDSTIRFQYGIIAVIDSDNSRLPRIQVLEIKKVKKGWVELA